MSTERRPLRVLAFTSIRSDYGLLSVLYERLHADPQVTLGLIVSGAHLSHTYGHTVRHVETDGLPIVARIESLLDANTPSSRLKTAAILMQSACDVVAAWQPDVILFPGDREDAMVAALLGAFLRIPTVHFFGGDHADDGNVDNAVRHACSKLASLHFVVHAEHAARLRALGEPRERVHVIGSPALDRLVATPAQSRAEVCAALGRPSWAGRDFAVVIYHPILGYEGEAAEHFAQVLEAIRDSDLVAFVSAPNSDAGNRDIFAAIERYRGDEAQFYFYRNLESERFVNLLRHAALLIGNSSCGILEAPLLKLGVVNVGARQRGRLHADNVIFVDQDPAAIVQAIAQVRSPAFQERLRGVESPFGTGDASGRAHALLTTLDLQSFVTKPEDPLAALRLA